MSEAKEILLEIGMSTNKAGEFSAALDSALKRRGLIKEEVVVIEKKDVGKLEDVFEIKDDYLKDE